MKAAYIRKTAVLLHTMTHNHCPEVREVATIRPQAAQRARNACPRCILHQRGMPTNTSTRIWNPLQVSIPSTHHTILTNHTCEDEGYLAVLRGDLHDRPKGTINTINGVSPSLKVVYVTLPKMLACILGSKEESVPRVMGPPPTLLLA